MRSCVPMFAMVGLLSLSSASRADDRGTGAPLSPITTPFALDLSGVRYGFVRAQSSSAAAAAGEQRLALTTPDIAPALTKLIDGFAQGNRVKRDVRLTSGAVVRKANDARLVSIKLPAIGGGGAADVELAFLTPALTTQPLLSAKEAPPPPASARITAFRIDVSGMQAIEAPKLEAMTLAQSTDGSVSTGEIAIEVAAGGAPPFVAWQRASSARAAPRSVRLEYVGGDGAPLLELRFDRCTPSSVNPRGESGTTRITLACAAVHGGG